MQVAESEVLEMPAEAANSANVLSLAQFIAEHHVGGYAHVVEENRAAADRARADVVERGARDAGQIHRHEERADAAGALGFAAGAREDDRDVGLGGLAAAASAPGRVALGGAPPEDLVLQVEVGALRAVGVEVGVRVVLVHVPGVDGLLPGEAAGLAPSSSTVSWFRPAFTSCLPRLTSPVVITASLLKRSISSIPLWPFSFTRKVP